MKHFTGTCICGHSWDDHHHGFILNPQALIDAGEEHRNVHGILGEECEFDQCNGEYFVDDPCRCNNYEDVGWVENSETTELK